MLPSLHIRYQLAFYHNWKQDQGATHESEMEKFMHFREYMTWPRFIKGQKGKETGKGKCDIPKMLEFIVSTF